MVKVYANIHFDGGHPHYDCQANKQHESIGWVFWSKKHGCYVFTPIDEEACYIEEDMKHISEFLRLVNREADDLLSEYGREDTDGGEHKKTGK